MTLFTIKYAQKNSQQVFGQEKAATELKDYIVNYKMICRKTLVWQLPLAYH